MDLDGAFKLFDVRGSYPQVVNERFAFVLGKTLAHLRHPKKVLVCCDTRESSPSLKEFLADGLGSGEVLVFDLGEAPTPMFNFAMTLDDYDLGVMVTASHVAADENGFKIIAAGPLPLDQKEMADIKAAMAPLANEAIVVPKMTIQKVGCSDLYLAEILKRTGTEKFKLKLALDATRSSVLTTALVLFQKLASDFHFVDSKHFGNPLLEINRKALAADVIATKSDLGVIWDSDGDRVVFVDRNGVLIPMSFVLGILGASAVAASRQGKVAVDIRSGLVVRDLVVASGGELEIFPAWNTYLKFAIKENPGIVFAGETSGHYIFTDFFGIDDGILAALIFLRLFEKGYVEEKLKELGKKYFELPEKNIPCSMDKSVSILESLTQSYRSTDYLVSVADGLTVFGPDFKFNLRQSLTEPFLRLNLEATSEAKAKIIVDKITGQIDEAK